MAGRSPSLARHAPLKRSQVEDTVVIKRTTKTPTRKGAFKPSVPSKTARKSKGTAKQSKQKKEELRELLRELLREGETRQSS
jgi:hypothetical protein